MDRLSEARGRLDLAIDHDDFEALLDRVVTHTLSAIDWSPGRIAFNEAEAADALGIKRHVVREARLVGLIDHIKIGKRVGYRRRDLLD